MEILLLDSQEDGFFFLDGEDGLVLKADCGPILLHISEGKKKKKKKRSLNFHKSICGTALADRKPDQVVIASVSTQI